MSGTYLTAQSATISNGVLTAVSAIEFTVGGSAGSWTFTNGSKTLRATADDALSLATSGGVNTWTITIAGSSPYNATIAPSSTYTSSTIQYNSGAPRFRNYTSSQSPIQLYKKEASCTSHDVVYDHEGEGDDPDADEACEDDEVSFTPSPSSGYRYDGATVFLSDLETVYATLTSSETTFTMPDEDVYVVIT